jgi:hypothetical protein
MRRKDIDQDANAFDIRKQERRQQGDSGAERSGSRSITGHLSRRMLEPSSHIRLSAKKAALDRLNERRAAKK